jgi:hypothetical protein
MHWAENAANRTSDVKNDIKIEGLKTADLHLFVSLAEVKGAQYNRVWVQLSNHGSAALNFDPQSAILLRGDRSVRPESPDKAANSVQGRGPGTGDLFGALQPHDEWTITQRRGRVSGQRP